MGYTIGVILGCKKLKLQRGSVDTSPPYWAEDMHVLLVLFYQWGILPNMIVITSSFYNHISSCAGCLKPAPPPWWMWHMSCRLRTGKTKLRYWKTNFYPNWFGQVPCCGSSCDSVQTSAHASRPVGGKNPKYQKWISMMKIDLVEVKHRLVYG